MVDLRTWQNGVRIYAVVIISLLIFGWWSFYHRTSNGYHIIWSQVNMRWVWVDKDGRP